MFEKEWGPSGFFRGTGSVQAGVPGSTAPRAPPGPGVENEATPILRSGPTRAPGEDKAPGGA